MASACNLARKGPRPSTRSCSEVNTRLTLTPYLSETAATSGHEAQRPLDPSIQSGQVKSHGVPKELLAIASLPGQTGRPPRASRNTLESTNLVANRFRQPGRHPPAPPLPPL